MTDRQNLVLIPGLVCDAQVWHHQLHHLDDIALMTVPPVDQAVTMEEMARSVLETAPDHFALAGFSMGGYVALEILRQAPDRITRIALLDTSAREDTQGKSANRLAAIKACEDGSYAEVIDKMMTILLHPDRQVEPLADFVRDMAARVGADAFARRHRAMMTRKDARDLLASADIPLRAICGRQDAMSSVEDHSEMAELAPGGRLSIIEECGHMTILERPHAASALLRDWLAYG